MAKYDIDKLLPKLYNSLIKNVKKVDSINRELDKGSGDRKVLLEDLGVAEVTSKIISNNVKSAQGIKAMTSENIVSNMTISFVDAD